MKNIDEKQILEILYNIGYGNITPTHALNQILHLIEPTAEANANTVLGEASHYLKEAYSELRIIASYADDPRTQIGMTITARACKDLCDKIKDAGFA